MDTIDRSNQRSRWLDFLISFLMLAGVIWPLPTARAETPSSLFTADRLIDDPSFLAIE
ncbi:hypothetical protein HY523_01565, partial [Candidatus Berkelbacteria bacterium]|nr:hypothetical protein [Candidatus Berkelbacteria bacterium]